MFWRSSERILETENEYGDLGHLPRERDLQADILVNFASYVYAIVYQTSLVGTHFEDFTKKDLVKISLEDVRNTAATGISERGYICFRVPWVRYIRTERPSAGRASPLNACM